MGRYLGASLLHQRVGQDTYAFLLTRMRKKLSGLKANPILFVGHVMLAQTSPQNIPGYVMQTVNIPIFVYDKLNALAEILFGVLPQIIGAAI